MVGLYGIPGSGESFLLDQLKQELGEQHFAFYEGLDNPDEVTLQRRLGDIDRNRPSTLIAHLGKWQQTKKTPSTRPQPQSWYSIFPCVPALERRTKERVLLGIRDVGYNIVAYKAVIMVSARHQ